MKRMGCGLFLFLVFQANLWAQMQMTAVGRAYGPKGGMACRVAENRALDDMHADCTDLGGRLSEREIVVEPCSCIPSNDHRFEKCAVLLRGNCYVPRRRVD